MGYDKQRNNTHSKFGLSSKSVQFEDKGGGGTFNGEFFNAIPLLASTYNELETDGQWNYFPTETSVQLSIAGSGGSAGATVRNIPIWQTDYTGVDKFPPYTCVNVVGTASTSDRFNMYRLTFLPGQFTPFGGSFVFSSVSDLVNEGSGEEITGQSESSGILAINGDNLGGAIYYTNNMKTLTWSIYYDNTISVNDTIHFNFHLTLF